MARNFTRSAYMKLAAQLRPELRRAYRASVADMANTTILARLNDAIYLGDVDAIMAALNIRPEFLAPMANAIAGVYQSGGAAQLAAAPRRIAIRFDGRHPRAEAAVANQATKIIGVILEDERESIRNVLSRRLIERRTRSDTVLDLVGRRAPGTLHTAPRKGGLVGLGWQRAGWVESARDELSGEIDANYFTRKLRDRRYDSTIKKSIRTGTPLSKGVVNKITGRYADRQLKARGETIARTETHAALNQGKEEAINQLIDRGGTKLDAVKKIWEATPSIHTRDTHIGLNGQVRPKALPFTSSSGATLMYPHDPSAPAKETINCRCTATYRIDYTRQAR